MRSPAKAALAAMCFAAAATSGFAAAPREDSAPPKNDAKAAPPSIDGIVGKKLIAIDGSMIALAGSEGGLSREIVAPNGAVQKMNFTFINDRLGTVADSRDAKNAIGVFRMTDADIDIEYADGSSEKLSATSGGGISVETQSGRDSFCSVWFPEGHTFSLDDRKAALAQYATRLGLGDLGAEKKEAARVGCNMSAAPAATPTRAAKIEIPGPKTETAAAAAAAKTEATVAKPDTATATAKTDTTVKLDATKTEAAAKIEPAVKTDAGKPEPAKLETASAKTTDAVPVPVPSPAPRTAVLASAGAAAAAAKSTVPKIADLGNAKTIDVRTSEVHPIDPPAVAEPPAKPEVLASVVPPSAPPSAQRGASSCLTVESDGSHWGFRNHCGYTVQFAYCLMAGGGQLAACKDGAVPGSVSANGFGSLVADESLKETDVAHDFRWVACQGGAGEVIPRLDQTDPPVGRCVR